ncbi:MAG: 5'-nucleotidase C-terminal domain-containing protein [Thermodesulfovibrionales bacterium]|nr:5'-nucleotidase C-terminal domain-containing protein [Thermodesulfovibrionales bacterium]
MKRFVLIILFLCCFTCLHSDVSAVQTEIRILYVNDFHGFAEPYKPFGSDELLGGMAYLAGRVETLRREKPSLLLAAGDMIQGNDWANLFQGESVLAIMNAMRFDGMVLGNHEFDFGQDVLKKRISAAHFPVLGANVKGVDRVKPYIITQLGGITVAVIGVVTDETPVSTHPKNVEGLLFIPPADVLPDYIAELRENADLIVVLSHIGYSADRILAEKVSGIDIIVGGHSHTKLTQPVIVQGTLILQAWEHAKALGILDVTVDSGAIIRCEGRLEEIKPVPGTEERGIETTVKAYRQDIDHVLLEKIGKAENDLDGENVRKRETNFGDFVADVIRLTAGSDVAIINGGGIRTSIKQGDIFVRNIYSALPFDNYLIAFRISGTRIRETLEHGVSAVEEEAGRFPQVSGLTFTYNPSAPKGARTRDIFIAGKPVEPDREYTVATNDFLAAGGDGYRAFGDALKETDDFSVMGGMIRSEKIVYSDYSRWLRDDVIAYIREKKVIAPSIEMRIVEVP